MQLLTTERSPLLSSPHQIFPMLFNGPENLQKFPFPSGCRPLSNTWFLRLTWVSHKRFTRFGSAHERDQQTDRQIYRRTTLLHL